MVLPVVNVIVVFLPVSLPLCLIFAEALTTANVLATSEALIHFGMGTDDARTGHAGDAGSDKSSDTGGKHRGKTKFFQKKYLQMSGGGRSSGSDDADSSQDSDEDCVDEYQDEDIDDRFVVDCQCQAARQCADKTKCVSAESERQPNTLDTTCRGDVSGSISVECCMCD